MQNTPICSFLKNYSQENMLRMHMPGHKGKNIGFIADDILEYDITEIKDADSLFECNGIIEKSEALAASLFGTLKTIYSVQGSTLVIQTMLGLMKLEKRGVIAVRNSHRAFLNACALLDMEVEWVYPDFECGIIGGKINNDDIERILRNSGKKMCVYITSPDYAGNIADIKSISEICRKYDAPLLVDNAHGSCLAFLDKSQHPIHLGADICCDSAHKMLPAMTSAAYMHINNKKYVNKAKKMMSVFASTSPSYIVLASLDFCNHYISGNIYHDVKSAVSEINMLKSELEYKYNFVGDEPFHITITGTDGNYMADRLRDYGIECEYSDFNCIVLLASPINSKDDFSKLKKALSEIIPKHSQNRKIDFPRLFQEISLKEALFSPSEEIKAEFAEGKICASLNVPCPPAIPIAVCGERITRQCIELYNLYDIKTVNIVST